jgi:hypothetical protein
VIHRQVQRKYAAARVRPGVSTADDTARSLARSLRIYHHPGQGVISFVVPILAKLPNVAEHVVDTHRVGRQLPNGVSFHVGIGGEPANGPHRGVVVDLSRSAGPLPLSFRGQPIRLLFLEAQPRTELLGIVVGDEDDGVVVRRSEVAVAPGVFRLRADGFAAIVQITATVSAVSSRFLFFDFASARDSQAQVPQLQAKGLAGDA